MDEDTKVIIGFIAVAVIIVACVLGVGAVYNSYECQVKTADIGYAHRWSIVGGCQIEVEDDRWIPLDAYYFEGG